LINVEGTVWPAAARIVTGVVGSGVLPLAWSMAKIMGWIAGPLISHVVLFCFNHPCFCFPSMRLLSIDLLILTLALQEIDPVFKLIQLEVRET